MVYWEDENGSLISIETRTPDDAPATLAPSSPIITTPATPTEAPTSSLEISSTPIPAPVASTSATLSSSLVPKTTATPPPPASTSSAPGSAAQPEEQARPAPASEASSAPSSSSGDGSSSVSNTSGGANSPGLGITYSPYNADQSCKSQPQITSDFATLAGFSKVRIYGVDCDQVSLVIQAASSHNMKVFAGLTDITNFDTDMASFISQVDSQSGWDMIDTFSVCNECVNDGTESVNDVVNAIANVRGLLAKTAFSGSVVTVDTFNQLESSVNTALCDSSDYCAANCHAYFDDQVSCQSAGSYVREQYNAIAKMYPNKPVVITESGWPYEGPSNGAAIASLQCQQEAIASLKAEFSSNLFLFTAFDDLWKDSLTEQSFGIFGH